MSKRIPPRDDEEEAAIRPMILDMYYFWNSETYTLTESEERTLNQLIYEGLPPRIPLDHVKREVSFVFNEFNNTKKTLQQIKFYSVNLVWHLILLVNCPVTRLQKQNYKHFHKIYHFICSYLHYLLSPPICCLRQLFVILLFHPICFSLLFHLSTQLISLHAFKWILDSISNILILLPSINMFFCLYICIC